MGCAQAFLGFSKLLSLVRFDVRPKCCSHSEDRMEYLLPLMAEAIRVPVILNPRTLLPNFHSDTALETKVGFGISRIQTVVVGLGTLSIFEDHAHLEQASYIPCAILLGEQKMPATVSPPSEPSLSVSAFKTCWSWVKVRKRIQ